MMDGGGKKLSGSPERDRVTVEEAKEKLLAWVTAQLGTREGANNYNKYAEDSRLMKLYGWSLQNQPWCDLFTDEAFIECFGLETGAAMTYQRLGSGSAACRQSAQFFRDNGAFVQTPEPGDVVFFYVGGAINHQGIVVRVDGGGIVTVEGNSSDAVSERSYRLSDPGIAGYGRPRWELAAGEDAATAEREIRKPVQQLLIGVPLLAKGDVGGAVAAAQGTLKVRGYDLGAAGVDGDFGGATERAVMAFQQARGLDVDGVVGRETWTALLKE